MKFQNYRAFDTLLWSYFLLEDEFDQGMYFMSRFKVCFVV